MTSHKTNQLFNFMKTFTVKAPFNAEILFKSIHVWELGGSTKTTLPGNYLLS